MWCPTLGSVQGQDGGRWNGMVLEVPSNSKEEALRWGSIKESRSRKILLFLNQMEPEWSRCCWWECPSSSRQCHPWHAWLHSWLSQSLLLRFSRMITPASSWDSSAVGIPEASPARCSRRAAWVVVPMALGALWLEKWLPGKNAWQGLASDTPHLWPFCHSPNPVVIYGFENTGYLTWYKMWSCFSFCFIVKMCKGIMCSVEIRLKDVSWLNWVYNYKIQDFCSVPELWSDSVLVWRTQNTDYPS